MPISVTLLHHDTSRYFEALVRDDILGRARRLARLAREQGLGALDRARDPLVDICAEFGARNRVTKNSLGVLDLAWQAAEHPEWAAMIGAEAGELKAAIRRAHGVELRNLIWTGMGGSAEDKSMYSALGLLDGGVRVFLLDSTDPAKLAAILALLPRRGERLERALRSTLVVGMAMGMTSYEPVVNLEKLDLLYRKRRIPSQANFLYMTLPDSLLDRFAGPRGYRRVELQPDNDNTVAGRHSGPLTRGSLYPLALNGVDLAAWIAATALSDEEVRGAFRLAAFLHGNGIEGRDKATLLLPRQWRGAGVWTKQDFEESLGKSEKLGIKIFPAAAPRYAEDGLLCAVRVAGAANPPIPRRKGYPLAVVELGGAMPLARYMQWVHHVVFGLGWLRRMNFVTQPSVELYKQITNQLYNRVRRLGRLERTSEWARQARTPFRASARGGITLYYDSVTAAGLLAVEDLANLPRDAAGILAGLIGRLRAKRSIEYGELTFYGDTRYRPAGRRLRALLEEASGAVFGSLGMSADVYEGPAMNHSYHEMIIGHGRCFSVAMLARRQASIPSIDYRADYHRAQWLATKLALERRGRAVVALTFPDLSATSLRALRGFFGEVARRLA